MEKIFVFFLYEQCPRQRLSISHFILHHIIHVHNCHYLNLVHWLQLFIEFVKKNNLWTVYLCGKTSNGSFNNALFAAEFIEISWIILLEWSERYLTGDIVTPFRLLIVIVCNVHNALSCVDWMNQSKIISCAKKFGIQNFLTKQMRDYNTRTNWLSLFGLYQLHHVLRMLTATSMFVRVIEISISTSALTWLFHTK